MNVFTKFNSFVDFLAKGGLDLATDTLKVMLTNTAPVATNGKYSDISGNELANGDGYTTGGSVVAGVALTNANGTETLAVGQTVFQSNGGSMGPFRYAVYYDASAANNPLIGFYDYGSSVTLNGANNETFTLAPANGQLLTLA